MPEYVTDFGDKSSAFVRLAMAEAVSHGAVLKEEIVRCGDCRYASAGEAVISGNWQHGNCHNPRFRGSLHGANARADGFCAWGERRDA